MRLQGILDNILWGFLLVLLVPSGLAIASWNSLPGSMLYKVKLSMEQALLAVAPTYQAKGDLQVAFTERRFSEAKQLLANRSSVEGLTYLDDQVAATKREIENAPNREVQIQLAQKYIATLQNMNTQLEQQKQLLAVNSPPNTAAPATTSQRGVPTYGQAGYQPAQSGQPPAPINPNAPSYTQTGGPVITQAPPVVVPPPSGSGTGVNPVVPTNSPVPTAVVTAPPNPQSGGGNSGGSAGDAINNTQDQINQTINDLNNITSNASKDSQAPKPNHDQSDEHHDNGNGSGSGKDNGKQNKGD